jgi:hypothetical protein
MGKMMFTFITVLQRQRRARAYQVAVLELHELLGALVFVHRVVVGKDTLAVHGSLYFLLGQNIDQFQVKQ